MARSFHEEVSNALGSVISRDLAVPVRYERGDLGVDLEKVGVGESTFEVSDEQGLLTEVRVRDYFIPAIDLVLPGVGFALPKKGDRIIETIAGKAHVYEVLPPGGSEPAWRWMDPAQLHLRVHTKLIEREGDCDE